MDFEFERNIYMPCGNDDCHYWNDLELQNCGKEGTMGEPAPSTCPGYIPREEDQSQIAIYKYKLWAGPP